MSNKVQTQAKAQESTSVTPAPGQFQSRPFFDQEYYQDTAAAQQAAQKDEAERNGHAVGKVTVRPEDLKPSSSGRPLPEPVRQKMETALGADFSDVRVHEGPEAQAIGAQAYTQGNHISFATGEYRPGWLKQTARTETHARFWFRRLM